MKVLLVAWDSGGGVEVTESVVRTCVGAGHTVTVLGTEGLRRRMERAGGVFRTYRHAPDNDRSRPETDIIKDWEVRNPLEAFARIRDRVMFGPARQFCADVTEEIGRDRPDVVMVDVLIPTALCAAEAEGIARVLLVHALYGVPRPGATPMGAGFQPARNGLERVRDSAVSALVMGMIRTGLAPLNEARAELGLYPYDSPLELFDLADRILVCTSPSFDFEADSAPGNVVYLGPQSDHDQPAEWDDPWAGQAPRPLVLVSLSSTYMAQDTLLQEAAGALGRLDVHGLVTTGPTVDPESLRAPANVVVREWVRHADVLPDCAVVVSHGGHGTVLKTLAAGVPLVVLPQGRDQPDNAARVVHAGAGVVLKGKPTAARIEEAVRRVLDDPAYTLAARDLARRMAAERDDGRLVRELEAVAAGRPPTVRRRRRPAHVAEVVPLALPAELVHHRVGTDDGATLEVVERPGAGPTVFFLHGMGLSAEIWCTQFAGLADDGADLRLLAWDQRGCGASSEGTAAKGLDPLVEDLCTVLEALDVRRALLVGHSLGGVIALEAALARAERLAPRAERLLVASTTGGVAPAIGSGPVKDALFTAVSEAEKRWGFFSRSPGFVSFSTRMSFGPARPGQAERDLVRRLLESKLGHETEMLTVLATHDARDRLGGLAWPVTVVAGTRDNFLPLSHARRLADALPEAELVAFERAGHMLFLEQPARFNALVARLATLVPAPRSPAGTPA